MSLFELGDFTLHGGQHSRWKVECDALSTADWDALAVMAVERLALAFDCVHGVPRGGLPFERALWPHVTAGAERCLVVDDVLTTGGSLKAERYLVAADRPGLPPPLLLVAFARGPVPDGVHALWTLAPEAGR